jgi:hypothetical protein
LLSDDDLREPRETRVSAAQFRHSGSREDGAKPRILLHHFGDRALEVGLGLEVTNYGPRQRILTISGNIFCPSRIKAKNCIGILGRRILPTKRIHPLAEQRKFPSS